ncbi:hypothetical protein ACROYT_G043583 [Oculina patagonica]
MRIECLKEDSRVKGVVRIECLKEDSRVKGVVRIECLKEDSRVKGVVRIECLKEDSRVKGVVRIKCLKENSKMLRMKRPSHTTHHTDASTEQSEQKRSQFENAVLKAYGIVPAYGCSSSPQGMSDVDLKPSQTRRKESDYSFALKNETASSKSEENDLINDKVIQNPFATGQPWQSAQTAVEVIETVLEEYEKEVLKAYGLFF